jgi:ACS family hexuronate transporter-like MFS transporter
VATSRSFLAGLGQRKWLVCAMLFFATTINYADRQVLGLLKPLLQEEFGWSEIDYGDIVFTFQLFYAIGLLGVGRLLDWIGVRRGYAGAVVGWSLAAMAHSLASTVGGFSIARAALGLSEAANFPAAVKAVSEWFRKSERALATGIFNAGANIGVLVTALGVPPLVAAFGWQGAFIATGSLGLIWLVFWLILYRNPPVTETQAETAADAATAQTDRIGWGKALRARETWAFAAGKFLTDPIWWFFLFWLPDYFGKTHGLDLKSFGPPLIAIYLISDFGSVAGGGLSSYLIKRGWTVNAGRKTAMLICALCVVPIAFVGSTDNLWLATLLIALAAAAHQAWSANLLTLPADTMPARAVASAVGFGGMAGAIGGMLMAKFVGYILETTGNYAFLFALISASYLVALGVIHLLAPRIRPARDE